MKAPQLQQRGFSLIELVVVTVILGILAIIIIPRLSTGADKTMKAETTAYKIVTDLRRTRQLAISKAIEEGGGEQRVELRFLESEPYTKYIIMDNRTQPDDTILETVIIDPDVSITGPWIMEFNGDGTLVGTTPEIITVSGGTGTFAITVNLNGYISISP